ncbi:FAD/NAD(P)-binding protein [Streptomyces sp. NPDC087216]|uniref:FAD/NAD(P)-binding protein n=1 Tax=Streptomyces sp. NPDC087216 TaxID=3365768 RepID=UPI0037F4C75C
MVQRSSAGRRAVAVVGVGAAGAMVAVQLCEAAARRGSALELLLIDPGPEAGRGAAYATGDPRHRLNVPAGNMSCYPDDPGHFVRWLCRHGSPEVSASDFVERQRYGAYLADTLGRAVIAAHGTVAVRRLRTRATGCRWQGRTARIELADGGAVDADCVVLATGPGPVAAPHWAPAGLRRSGRFVTDPWAPGALDAVLAEGGTRDVLLVGTGLTSVDIALSLDRPGRTVHAVSRGGRLPQSHALTPLPATACEDHLDGLPLVGLRAAIRRHVGRVLAAQGDWRPAVDGLRPLTARLWGALSEEDRAAFVEQDSALWNVHRHRMPPATAEAVSRMRRTRRLRPRAGRVLDARPGPDGSLTVVLAPPEGRETRELTVGWVVNCTGAYAPVKDTADPLWRGLLDDGGAVPGPLGMGVGTDRGRLRGADGRAGRPVWTLGAPRRGELWETTAVPEIRGQAAAVADAVLGHLAGPAPAAAPVRRPPRDTSGFPLSTHDAAAAVYRSGTERLLTPRAGAVHAFRRAAVLDPGFALAHAALALTGHEAGAGAGVDVARALADARRAVAERGSAHERSWVEAVAHHVRGTGADQALVRHLDAHPGDLTALATAVPGVTSSGLSGLDGTTARRLAEQAYAARPGHWFPASVLALVRQEEGRYEEAEALAGKALAAEPASGHAVHALAHVDYERGRHRAGLERLDRWLADRQGPADAHRAHLAWHAALHELALGDGASARRRWEAELSPAEVRGPRALVDSCTLLWRVRLTGGRYGGTEVHEVLDVIDRNLLERPDTAFTAMHAAFALAAAVDPPGLRRLRAHALRAGRVPREVVAPLCEALEHFAEERWGEAATGLGRVLPSLGRAGGSAAQREVAEEALLYALVAAGRPEEARTRLEERLSRRPSPHDRTRANALPRGERGNP